MPKYTATVTCDWKVVNSQTNELLIGWVQQPERNPLVVTYEEGELVLVDGRPNQSSAQNYIMGINRRIAAHVHDLCIMDEELNKKITSVPVKIVTNNINLIKIE